jgi:hypothetical protein
MDAVVNATSYETDRKLDRIRFPSDRFWGCVYTTEPVIYGPVDEHIMIYDIVIHYPI